ncbi:actin-domain-containing protein [Mrakia frigida]|uniref:actin-domain-containing protein n=1 Tax=Mrakia frigida TaxID=29902 RepID=UPI003FCC1463
MDFKGARVIIIDSSPDFIRGIHGLDELLKTPSFEMPARVGRRKTQPDESKMDVDVAGPSSSKKAKVSSYLVGKDLEDALAAGEELEVTWPLRGKDAWSDWRSIEALWKHTLYSIGPYHRRTNDSPVLLTHPSTLSNLQIHHLTQTLFERLNLPAISLLSRPLASLYAMNSTTGVVIDVGYESTTVSPVSDSTVYTNGVVEVPLGIRHCEAYMAKLLAEVPSVIEALTSPLPAPEVEASTSEGAAAPPPPPSYPETPLPETLLRLAKHLWKTNTIRPLLMGGQMLTVEEEEGVNDIAAALAAGKERALIEAKAANAKSHKSAARQAEDAKKKAAAAAADGAAADADVVLIEFEGREFYLGRVRNKFCEPLFEPMLFAGLEGGLEGLGKPSEMVAVQEAVQSSIGTVFGREKLALWEGVVVVGELARIKTLPAALLSHLMPYILTDPDSASDSQPKNTRFLRIPKHFPEYVDEGGWVAPFLGASIVGKLVYADSTGRFVINKVQYNLSVRLGFAPIRLSIDARNLTTFELASFHPLSLQGPAAANVLIPE